MYDMKRMRKGIITLSFVAILAFCMFNDVAAAPESTSTTVAHGAHVTDVRGYWWDIPKKPKPPDPLMYITITDYPKQVNVGETFAIHGFLMRGDNGIGNVQIKHYDNGNFLWTVTTNTDGSFTDTFHFDQQGPHQIAYIFQGSGCSNIVYLSGYILQIHSINK
jgi:hypothetical protein